MKKIILISVIIVLVAVLGFLLLRHLSSYIGWYGYKKWERRIASVNLAESKKRGVFVKQLNYEVDSLNGYLPPIEVYIEKGFYFGKHSSEEAVLATGSRNPYNFRYTMHPDPDMLLSIRKTDLSKFDSIDVMHGYLKEPFLKDTIILEVQSAKNVAGIIKVYE